MFAVTSRINAFTGLQLSDVSSSCLTVGPYKTLPNVLEQLDSNMRILTQWQICRIHHPWSETRLAPNLTVFEPEGAKFVMI